MFCSVKHAHAAPIRGTCQSPNYGADAPKTKRRSWYVHFVLCILVTFGFRVLFPARFRFPLIHSSISFGHYIFPLSVTAVFN